MPPPSKKQRSSQPKEYRKFDPLKKTIRDATIKGCVDIYLKHVKDNGGACKRGFLQSVVVTANEKASGLQITRDDIKNVVRRIEKEVKKNAAKISPIPNSSLHSIDNNLLSIYASSANDQSSTSSDDSQPTPLSGSSLSGLDILATAAANKRLIVHAGRRVLRESKKKGFSWTGAKLKGAIKYKRKKTDKRAMPTRKADLLKRWDEVKKNYSIDDDLSESEDESDDDESEDSDDGESDGASDNDDESRVVYGSDDSDESDDEAE